MPRTLQYLPDADPAVIASAPATVTAAELARQLNRPYFTVAKAVQRICRDGGRQPQRAVSGNTSCPLRNTRSWRNNSVDRAVDEEPLRIRTARGTERAIRPEVLVDERDLLATAVTVDNDLTLGTIRLATGGWGGVTAPLHFLAQSARLGLFPIPTVVEHSA